MESKKISILINRFLPEFVVSDYPNFVLFFKKYFEYIERKKGPYKFEITNIYPGNYDPSNVFGGEYIEFSVTDYNQLSLLKETFVVGGSSGAEGNGIGLYKINGNYTLKVIRTSTLPFQVGEILEYSDIGEYKQIADMFLFSDIDRTTEEFFNSYRDTLLNDFPSIHLSDFRFLVKRIRTFYASKGIEDSYKFLFSAVFGTSVDFYYPKVDILRCSDGKWVAPVYVSLVNQTQSARDFLTDKEVIGNTSNARGYIESFVLKVQTSTSSNKWYAVVKNVIGNFQPNEFITVNNTTSQYQIENYTDAVEKSPGYWENDDGKISIKDKRLQDNFYYQNFSYEIQSETGKEFWEKLITHSVHPAGLVSFDKLLAPSNLIVLLSNTHIKNIYYLMSILNLEYVGVNLNSILYINSLSVVLNRRFWTYGDIESTREGSSTNIYLDRMFTTIDTLEGVVIGEFEFPGNEFKYTQDSILNQI